MSQDISIKKGLSINIKGAAEKELKKIPLTKFYAHNLDDFHLLIPKLEVKVGDYVKRGQPLFYSKINDLWILCYKPINGFDCAPTTYLSSSWLKVDDVEYKLIESTLYKN